MLVLTEPISSGCCGVAIAAEHRAERLHLERIAQLRAGAVSLDVADVRGREAGAPSAPRGSTASCAGPLGAVSPLLGPSWLTALPRITREDSVAVGLGIAQALEHHDAAAFGAREAVGGCVEGLAAAVGRQHARVRQRDEQVRRKDEVDAAGQRHAATRRCAATDRPGARRRARRSRPCRP